MTEEAHERLWRLAQAAKLPEVERGTHFGKPALKVAGKGFTGYRGGDDISLAMPLEQKEMLLAVAPEIYYETDHYRGWPWVLIRMSAISDEELEQRLTDAWKFRAPKKLVAGFSGKS
jgi:hypothetical protein